MHSLIQSSLNPQCPAPLAVLLISLPWSLQPCWSSSFSLSTTWHSLYASPYITHSFLRKSCLPNQTTHSLGAGIMPNYFSDLHMAPHTCQFKQVNRFYFIFKYLVCLMYLLLLTFEKAPVFSNFQHHVDEDNWTYVCQGCRTNYNTLLWTPAEACYLYIMVTWEEHTKQSESLWMTKRSSGAAAFVNSHQCSANVLLVTEHRAYCEALSLLWIGLMLYNRRTGGEKEIDECHFSFFKVPCRVPGLQLELNGISLHRPISKYPVPQYWWGIVPAGPSVAQIHRCSVFPQFLWVLHP